MHSSWQAAAKMKRMRPDDIDDGQDQRFGLPGQASDVPVPSLTIRYPPVFDDDVSSQQFQYMGCRPRRQSYPPFEPSSQGQTYPPDRYFAYPQRPWQDSQGEQEAGSCYEAVDFSMNRDASSRGGGSHVHSAGVTPSASCVPSASFHNAGTNASPSHTPGRSVQDSLRGTPTFQSPDQTLGQMPLVQMSPSSEPFSFTLLHGSSVFQRNEPSYLSGPSYQHRSYPEGAAPPGQGTRVLPLHVPDLPAGLTSADDKPCHKAEETQQLVYYNLDTPQSSQAGARDLVTAHYQIEDDSMGVPLHLRPLLSSNKGASKQRRDQINAEIAVMRDLLPLAESARQRLSQLQIMSLSCVYIRKCNVLDKLFRSSRQPGKDNLNVPSCDFFQALTGFLLIATREGKLVYISENVTDYLGHSMVDMKTQGDSLYDIVDKRDHGTVQAQLLQAGTDSEGDTRDVAFFCRMNMSRSLKRQAGFGDVKVMYVKGHFVSHPGPESSSEQQLVFMGTCTPLITPDLKENLIQNNTMVFKTVHQLDLSFLEVSHTAEYHLGYSNGELFRRSWYSLLHPEDLQEAREKHVQLIRSNHEMGCMMIVRMIRADNSIFWVNVVMHIKQASVSNSDDPVIVCVNQVISEQEAYQFKLQSQMFQFYPPRGEPWQQTVPCPTMVQEQDTRWLQPSSGFQASTRMRATQAGPVYASQSGCQTGHFMPYIDPRLRRGDQLKNGGSGQTERLKEMLKRKIKGPCKPTAKVPRLSPSGNDDKLSGQGFDFGSSSFMIPNLDNFRDSFPALSLAQGGWAEPTQVMSQSNNVFSAVALQQKKNILMEPSSLSPGSMLQEQVVPEINALPESYLTPDPSPASSPDPNSKVFKVDVITPSKSTPLCPKTIIDELKQLANCGPKIKSEPLPTAPVKKRKELPVIDPFEIESFFWDFDVSKPNPQCPEDAKVNLPCHEVSKKTDSIQVKPKKNLPLIDATELEEFFNHFNGETTPYIDAQMLVDSAGTFFDQQALVKEEDCRPVIKVECSNSPASQSMSPFSMTSCDLSEEEELIEELTSTPLEMTLSVTVKDEYLPLTTPKPCGSYEEEDFFQIQKLLTSLAPTSGAIALSEETQ